MEQQIQANLADKNYIAAIKGFSTLELQVEESSLWEESSNSLGIFFYTSYLACYLIVGDIVSAKYLWKRAPAQLKSPESGSFLSELWTVAQAIWQNDLPAAICSMLIDWNVELQFLVFDLRDKLLTRQLDTFAKTYEHIPVESLVQKLGISQEETLERVQSSGWVVENLVARPSCTSSQPSGLGESLSDNLALLQQVTGYAAHFDRAPVAVDK